MNTRREIPMDGSTLTVQVRWPVKAIAIDNQSNVAVLVTDGQGNVYTCQAGQYLQVVIADSINVQARSSIASSRGQATLYLASDVMELGGSGGSLAPSTSGRGNWYDRVTAYAGPLLAQSWATASIGGVIYDVPDSRLAVIQAAWLRWERTAAPATRRTYTLIVEVFGANPSLTEYPVKLVVPAWQTRPGVAIEQRLATPFWLPSGATVALEGFSNPSGTDAGVSAELGCHIVEYNA